MENPGLIDLEMQPHVFRQSLDTRRTKPRGRTVVFRHQKPGGHAVHAPQREPHALPALGLGFRLAPHHILLDRMARHQPERAEQKHRAGEERQPEEQGARHEVQDSSR